ncbi:hypothetical protein D3C78_1103810 [compost metagenome]
MRPALPRGHQHRRTGEKTARPHRYPSENRDLARRKLRHGTARRPPDPACGQRCTKAIGRTSTGKGLGRVEQAVQRQHPPVDQRHAPTGAGHPLQSGARRCASARGVPGGLRVAGHGPGSRRHRANVAARQDPRPAGKGRLSGGISGQPGQPLLRPAIRLQRLRRTSRTQAPGADWRLAARQSWWARSDLLRHQPLYLAPGARPG